MEKYKLKDFSKWAKKEGLSDRELSDVLDEMNQGLVGDRLGADIYKKRIGLAGRGKRGGVRVILIYRQNALAVFLYGYPKNEKSDLEPREERALRLFAKEFMQLSPAQRAQRVTSGALVVIEEQKI